MEPEKTITVYVKFPRDQGFVVYPVEVQESVFDPECWDLYGSVTRYIKRCPYPKTACLADQPFYLTVFMTQPGFVVPSRPLSETEPVKILPQGPLPEAGLSKSYTHIGVLQYRAGSINDTCIIDGGCSVTDTWRTTLVTPKIQGKMTSDQLIPLWSSFRPNDTAKMLVADMSQWPLPNYSITERRRQCDLMLDFMAQHLLKFYEMDDRFVQCFCNMAVYSAPGLLVVYKRASEASVELRTVMGRAVEASQFVRVVQAERPEFFGPEDDVGDYLFFGVNPVHIE
jgi:hypothetical protein